MHYFWRGNMWTDWHIVPIMPSFCTINANKTRTKCHFICVLIAGIGF